MFAAILSAVLLAEGQKFSAQDFHNVTARSTAAAVTTVTLSYDAKNLYATFRCAQDGIPITALQSVNDVGFGSDDFVGLGIDTSGNGAQVYYFEATPAGTKYETASDNTRYTANWSASTRVDGMSWSAILAVPLKALRAPSVRAQTWRINFVRGIAAKAEHLTWTWNALMTDAEGAQWPVFTDAQYWPSFTLHFENIRSAVRPRPQGQIFALASAGQGRSVFVQPNGTLASEPTRDFGADFSVPLSDTVNFVGTLHPDFSNVDVDQQTITPQEFPRQIVEYRPFFAEGASFLNPNTSPSAGIFTPNNTLFYSPNIGAFDYGAKVEGNFGHEAFGLMNFAGINTLTGSRFNDTVYGFAHDLGNQTLRYWGDAVIAKDSIAGQDTAAEVGASDRNPAIGLEGGFDQAFEGGSYVSAPGHASSSNVYAGVQKPNYTAQVRYQDVTPNYNPIAGYTVISDTRGWSGEVMVTGVTPGTKNVQLFAGGDRLFDESGAVHQADFGANATTTFRNQISVTLSSQVGTLRSYALQGAVPKGCAYPALSRTVFTGYPYYSCPQAQQFTTASISLGYRDGTPSPVDAMIAEGPFGGYYLHQYDTSIGRQIGRHLSVSFAYDGTYADPLDGTPIVSQWLRRLIVTETVRGAASVSLEYRSITGTIGAITPPSGNNLALNFHQLYPNGNNLYLSIGTPSANQTLNRFIVKYVFVTGESTRP